MAIDVETAGMDFTDKQIIMLQIGDVDNQFVIDSRNVNTKPLKDLLNNPEMTWLGHNIKFDYKFIKRWMGADLQNVYDTMLAEVLINCGKKKHSGYSLGAVTQKYTGNVLDKEERNKFAYHGSSPYTRRQIEYGAADVRYLHTIKEKQEEQIKKLQLERVLELENKATLAFAEIEYNGFYFDAQTWLSVAAESKDALEALGEALDEIIRSKPELAKHIKKNLQIDIFGGLERDVNINYNSSSQMLKVFTDYGLNIESVNALELKKYRRDPFVSKYLEYKEKAKVISTYGEGFLDYMSADKKIRTVFWQILNTGRVSSGDKFMHLPNLQNIPRNNTFRNCFLPAKGNKIVSVDYSGQELSIIADGAKDPIWIEAKTKGQDLHSVCAEMVFGDTWREAAEEDCNYYKNDKAKCDCAEHGKLRTFVKCINFGLAYGMSKYKLSDTLNIDLDEADKMIEDYFKAFPHIKIFLERLGNYGKTKGYIRTYRPFSRIRWFTDTWSGSWNTPPQELGAIERASKNTPIQGTGADMIKLALVRILDYIRTTKFPAKLITQVHDEIGVEVPADRAQEWAEIQVKIMEEAGAEIITSLKMDVDYTITDKWSK